MLLPQTIGPRLCVELTTTEQAQGITQFNDRHIAAVLRGVPQQAAALHYYITVVRTYVTNKGYAQARIIPTILRHPRHGRHSEIVLLVVTRTRLEQLRDCFIANTNISARLITIDGIVMLAHTAIKHAIDAKLPAQLFQSQHLLQMQRLNKENTTVQHIHALLHSLPPGYPLDNVRGITITPTVNNGIIITGHLTTQPPQYLQPSQAEQASPMLQYLTHFPTLDLLTRATVFQALLDDPNNAKTRQIQVASHRPLTPRTATSITRTPNQDTAQRSELQLMQRRIDQLQMAYDQLALIRQETQTLREEQRTSQLQTKNEILEIKQQFMDFQRSASALLASLTKYSASDGKEDDEQK
jgi:hypothetical protein